MSEPDDLLWRGEYFFAAVIIAPCWLRVTLRPDVKSDAATADTLAGADDSKVLLRITRVGELLRPELQLFAEKSIRRKTQRKKGNI